MIDRLIFFALSGLFISCGGSQASLASEESVTIGRIERIQSEILGEEREIWVHVPGSFYGMNQQIDNYPVLYLMDGEIHFKSTVGILDQFSNAANANDLSPQMIIVGIVNTNRTRDLTPTKAVIGKDSSTLNFTGGAGKMADFVEQELIPFIDNKYPTNAHRTLIGHSFGGLFALHTLIRKPRLFANYLVIDPSMWYDDEHFSQEVLTLLAQQDFQDQNLYLAMANNMMPWMELSDVKSDTTEIMNQMASLQRFSEKLDSLETSGLQIQFEYFPRENHGQVPLLATYYGLRYFYSDYPFRKMMAYYYPGSEQGKKDIAVEIENHYRALSDRLGYTVLPMESYINAYAYGLHRFERPETAESLFALNVKNYPGSANAYAAMGNFYYREADTLTAVEFYKHALELEEIPYVRERLEDFAQTKDY